MDDSQILAVWDETFTELVRTPMGSDDPDRVIEAYGALFPGGPSPRWVDDPMQFFDLVIRSIDGGRYGDRMYWPARSMTFNTVMNNVAQDVEHYMNDHYLESGVNWSPVLRRRFWALQTRVHRVFDITTTIGRAAERLHPAAYRVALTSYDSSPLRRSFTAHSFILWVDALCRAGHAIFPPSLAARLGHLAVLYRHGLFEVFPSMALFLRPPTIHRDNRMRFHRVDGPSIHWPNVDLTWHLQGVAVNRQVVMEPDVDGILAACDTWATLRPVVQVYGWRRFVEELDLRVIHKGWNEYEGTLYESPEAFAFRNPGWGDPQYMPLLVARNGSPNRDGTWNWYGFAIPADVRRVDEAHAMLWGIPTNEWHATVVRT